MMERDHGTHKASKLASEDVISGMLDDVITIIMNRLPIRDAVRTSILSRRWRLKWTLLTQLDFGLRTCRYLVTLGPEGQKCFDSKIISRLLLDIKGPITKFSLYTLRHRILHVEDVNHWVLFLSRKGIKEFTLIIRDDDPPLTLPTHLFSCLELEHLELNNCFLHLPLTFHGFPNLLSLNLSDVRFQSGNCVEFITRCPLLEILSIGEISPISKFDAFDIEKLENLKKLCLPLCMLENMAMTASSIFQLLGFFPKLEELLVNLCRCKFVVDAVANTQLSTAFPCLKTLHLYEIDFSDSHMLSYAVEMILGSPNLQTLYITTTYENAVPPPAFGVLKLDCSRMRPMQLRFVLMLHFMGSEDEICLIKYLLAHSPYLESLDIYPSRFLLSDEKLKLTRKLLKLPRASPFAEVDFYEF